MSTIAMETQPLGGLPPAPMVLFGASALAYMTLDGAGISAVWMAAMKIVPIAVLLWLAATALAGSTRLLAIIALVFSATGDVLLAIPFNSHFVFGLGAFLLAQLTYTVTFARNARLSLCLAGRAFAILVAAAMLAVQILPAAGPLALPVALYIAAISAMALSAAAHRDRSSLLFAGALAFMASDALIAINRFLYPVPLSGTWIMLTYYAAQALLIIGLIRGELAPRRA
ncbi:lysoplasmalogenase [Microbulbifer elongatus]|uniref:Lysoplasmalogenase n=1 Tax=Microbulbifer elongatus TaxID=86173 RepID=A0ABT1NYL5_9GAMM|nr:lysoplasmalogenase [Microbulbifer elongatus]MCQ3828973.1 lysoplasmalogenase [Microbulbifer elongatus]